VSAEKLSPARLAEIAARAEAATPGPWAYVDEGDKGGNAWVVGEFYSIRTDDYPPLAGRVETHEYDEERGDFVQVTDYTRIICDSGMKHDDGPQIADAAFIAASRTDIPALLAHIAAVEAGSLKDVFAIMERRAESATVATPSLAGKPYCPSSGSEGIGFEDAWCCKCDHYRYGSEWMPDEMECVMPSKTHHGYGPTGILGLAHFVADVNDPQFPQEWLYDKEGCPSCAAWKERTPEADTPPRRLCAGALTPEAERAAYERAMRGEP